MDPPLDVPPGVAMDVAGFGEPGAAAPGPPAGADVAALFPLAIVLGPPFDPPFVPDVGAPSGTFTVVGGAGGIASVGV